jgi:hypothetical protein
MKAEKEHSDRYLTTLMRYLKDAVEHLMRLTTRYAVETVSVFTGCVRMKLDHQYSKRKARCTRQMFSKNRTS